MLAPMTALAAAAPADPPAGGVTTDAQIQTAAENYCKGDVVAAPRNDRGNVFKHPVTACRNGYVAGFKQSPSKDATCGNEASSNNQGDKQICEKAWDYGRSVGPHIRDTASTTTIQDAANQSCGDNIQLSRFGTAAREGTGPEICRAGYKAGYANSPSKGAACGKYNSTGNNTNRSICEDGYDKGKDAGNAVDPSQLEGGSDGSSDTTASKTAAGGDTATSEKHLDCEVQWSNPLTWVLCPIIDILSNIIQAVNKLIDDELNVNTDAIYDKGKTSAAYKDAWRSFRDIALGFLVIVGLVIVISQALGMDILDAYTVRKTLPRLLIAAIGITLSWPLMEFLIRLSNNLGFGVQHLIYAPFNRLNLEINFSFGGDFLNLIFGSVFTGAAVVGGIAAWIGTGGIGILMAYLGTAALALGIAIVVLIVRQIAIIFLMLVAPLAIIAFVLPNTHKYYKIWWESFSKALLMFPIIAGFIAVGRVFAAVALTADGNAVTTPVNNIVGFGAYFAPYFMIPLTFRFAGGALGGIGGFVNDRGKGGFDRLKNYRGEQRKQRIQAAKTSGLYRNNFGKFTNPITKKEHTVGGLLNKVGDYTIDGKDNLRIAAGTKLGRPGDVLFGRTARDLNDQVERKRIEHTGNAAKELQGRYHTGRALSGDLDHYADSLDDTDASRDKNGRTAKQGLINDFGNIRAGAKRDANGNYNLADVESWRGSGNETEHLKMAGYLATGNQGAREASAELKSDAIKLDTFKGAGKEETQRTDSEFLGHMIAAQAGRMENQQIADYHNKLVGEGRHNEAYQRTKQLQKLASPKRTSQAEGYGLEYEDVLNTKTGKMEKRALDVYRDPAGKAAQSSFGRASAGDIANGKAEDFKDSDGDLSGWGQTIIAAVSPYEMESFKNPINGKMESVIKYDQSKPPKPIPKTGQAKLDAEAATAKIQSIEGYAQGDTGVGGQIFRIMEIAGIEPKYAPKAPPEGMNPPEPQPAEPPPP